MIRLKWCTVRTWAGFDAGGSKGVLDVGVVDLLLGNPVVEFGRRTSILTGSIVIKIPAGLQKKWKTDRVHCTVDFRSHRQSTTTLESVFGVTTGLKRPRLTYNVNDAKNIGTER